MSPVPEDRRPHRSPEPVRRGRGALARLLFVGVALSGAWLLLPSLRRVEVEIRVAGLPNRCIDEVDLRLSKDGRLHHRLRLTGTGPVLPPWELWVRAGSYRLEGAVVCAKGAPVPRVSIGSRILTVDERRLLDVPIGDTCGCPDRGRSAPRSSLRSGVRTPE